MLTNHLIPSFKGFQKMLANAFEISNLCVAFSGRYLVIDMAYFKPSYGVNGLGLPMSPMDAGLHHAMGYPTGK